MIYLISDLHLTASDEALHQRFANFCSRMSDGDSLYILGDLFEYWLGDDAAEYLSHTGAQRHLADLSDRGVSLAFLAGNRDFLIGSEFLNTCQMKRLDAEHILEVGNRRILLMHGDSLCTDDVAHQQFRSMVLESDWQNQFLAKTIEERDALAKMARYRSDDGKATKTAEIMDVTESAVKEAMERHNVDLLIHGHTHRPAIHQLRDNQTTRYRVVLGDWGSAESVIALTENELRLYFANEELSLTLQ